MNILIHPFIACLFVLPLTAAAQAGSPPPELTSLWSAGEGKGAESVILIKDLLPDQRTFLWRDTSRNADGFLDLVGSGESLNLIRALRTALDKHALRDLGDTPIKLDHPLARFLFAAEESPNRNRVSVFFTDPSQDLMMMVTVWMYAKAGAKLYIIDEFMNAQVAGFRGTLSFMTIPSNKTKGLWKLTWIEGDKQFELYAEDRISDGRRTWQPGQIRALGEALTKR